MTDDFSRAVEGLRAMRPPYTDTRIKVTGYLDPVTGVVGNDPTASAQSGYLWVHGYPRGGNVQVIAGVGINPRIPNVQVKVGQNHARQAVAYEVVIDQNATRQFGSAIGAVGSNPPPVSQATTPSPTGLLTGGRVLPNAPDYGLTVFVEALGVTGWMGGVIAIDPSDVPSGTAEWVWAVFYSLPGEIPAYALSSVQVAPSKQLLLSANAFDAALPVGAYRLMAVSLATGQTDVTQDTSAFIDTRDWLTPVGLVTVGNLMMSAIGFPMVDANGFFMLRS